MGAWKNLLDSLKATINGPVVFGGTIFPTAENFPSMPAQVLQGGFFSLQTLDQLVDIPYQNLQLNQEVVVGEYILPDTSTHSLTKYRLIQMPPLNTKISEIVGYTLSDYWEAIPTGGSPGGPGNNGWTPVIGLENDGTARVVLKVLGWEGGTGPAPAIPANPYIGANGYTTKSLALNVKGAPGVDGVSDNARAELYYSVGVRAITNPTTVWPPLNTPLGTFFEFGSAYELSVINPSRSSRRFMIHGQLHLSNDNGSDSWVGQMWASNINSGVFSLVDENATREDWIRSTSLLSVHKLDLWYMINLPAVSTTVIKLKVAQVNGGQSLRSNPFIEAWGL